MSEQPSGPACVVAVGGIMASGKSTVARRLAARLDAEVVSADETRRDLFEHGARDAFVPGFSAQLYPEVLRRARALLEAGRPVVLDGSFRSRPLRAAARALAAEAGVPFRFVECRADAETCRERLQRRERAEGRTGWVAMLEAFLREWEPVEELAAEEHLVVDTSGPPASISALELELPRQSPRN